MDAAVLNQTFAFQNLVFIMFLLKASLFTILTHSYYYSTLIANVLHPNRNKKNKKKIYDTLVNLHIIIDWILYPNVTTKYY